MEQLEIENELREVVARITYEVMLATDQGRLDINLALEDALLPILKSVFNLPHLENLNKIQKNYPGIDLGDEHDRVCFQVTATTSLEKVKKTLKSFQERNYKNSFDELYVLVLANKQSSYSQESVDREFKNEIRFSTSDHIIDLGDILSRISSLRITAQKNALREFRLILGDVSEYRSLQETPVQVPKDLTINMAELEIPPCIYVAETRIDEVAVLEEAKEKLNARRSKYSKRSLFRMALVLKGVRKSNWVYHDGRIFTFSPIEGSELQEQIDLGTYEELRSEDLYESGIESNQNVFKQLLGVEIEEQLAQKHVARDRKEKFFYFNPITEGNKVRNETWVGKAKAKRCVFEEVPQKKDKSKLSHCKHLSFDLSFIYMDNQWFVTIVPSWYYSYNGYRSRFHDKLLSSQKRLEFNNSVRNHVRFIGYFLKNLNDNTGNGLLIGNLVEFSNLLSEQEDKEEQFE